MQLHDVDPCLTRRLIFAGDAGRATPIWGSRWRGTGERVAQDILDVVHVEKQTKKTCFTHEYPLMKLRRGT